MSQKMLLVTPNEADQQWMGSIINKHFPKYALVIANDAEEGFVVANEQRLLCAIVFDALEDMRGIDLCRRMRENNSTANLPILMYFHDAITPEQHIDSLDAGAEEVVAVPCQEMELIARLRVLLRIRRVEQQLQLSNTKLLQVAGTRSRELYRAEERCRMLFNTHRDGIFSVALDTDGAPQYYSQVNRVLCDWLGYTEDEFLQLPVMGIISQGRSEVILPRINSIREHKEFMFTGVLQHKSGHELPFDLHAIWQDTGETPEIFFIATPCVEESVVEKLADGIAEKSACIGHVVFEYILQDQKLKLHGAVKQTLGLSPGEIANLNWLQREAAVHPEDWPGLVAAYNKAIESIGKYRKIYRLQQGNEGFLPVEEQGFVLPNAAGEAEKLIGSIHNAILRTSKSGTANNLIRKGQKLETLGLLAGGIAHDFNNILATIVGLTELTLVQFEENKEVQKDLHEVLRSAHRARDLVRQILVFSQQDGTDRTPVYLHTLVREMLKLFQSSTPRNIRIVDKINRKSGPVLANTSQLQQIILNCCTHAIQSMRSDGGTLTLEVCNADISACDDKLVKGLSEGEYVLFNIAGPGAFNSHTLSQMHNALLDAGGVLRTAGNTGGGTSLHLYFPRVGYQELYEGGKNETPAKLGGRILLVDDELPILQFGEKALGRMGYDVEIAQSPVEALAVFAKSPESYALVITDQLMPKMTGVDMAIAIREIRKDIPVILCTGFSEELVPDEVQQAGIREVLMKPMLSTDLAKAIQRTFSDSSPIKSTRKSVPRNE